MFLFAWNFDCACFRYKRSAVHNHCLHTQVLEKVRNNKRPEIPDQCPLGLSKLIKKCFDQSPEKRPRFKVSPTIYLQLIQNNKRVHITGVFFNKKAVGLMAQLSAG